MSETESVAAGNCDRRTFVGICASAMIAPLFAGCASLVARPVTPVNGRIELALQQYPELAQRGGSLKLLPAGTSEPVYVLVMDDGNVAALSPICTHLGCTVEIQGPRLVCPCHGSTYDRSGEVLVGPAVRRLKQYRVDQNSNGMLTIHLQGAS
jgi:cytochrome b6-f complex iron-sulfur subunit